MLVAATVPHSSRKCCSDCHHFHIHIAATRITVDGKCVPDWQDMPRSEKILRQLEKEYELERVTPSFETEHAAPTTGQQRRKLKERLEYEMGKRNELPEPTALEKIQDAIDAYALPGTTLSELLEKLDDVGVKTQIKVTREGVVQGISYAVDDIAFAGGKLGKKDKLYTIQGLQGRGVELDWERDASAIALYAMSNSKQETRSP